MLSREEWRSALDRVAEAYDRFRPGYPPELPTDLTFLAQLPCGGRILEIGCGTGQLTMPFARAGYAIVGLEPGKTLASLARAKLAPYPDVRIVVSTLEDWIPDTPRFDLVLAAQSFHLVDPRRRLALVAELLSPRGALAVVWSHRLPGDSPAHRALQAAYAQHAPALTSDQLSQDTPFEDDIVASCLFESVFMRKYLWTHDYVAADYLGLLRSQATHETLPPLVRAALFNAVNEGLARCGGHIAVSYMTRLYVATRMCSRGDK